MNYYVYSNIGSLIQIRFVENDEDNLLLFFLFYFVERNDMKLWCKLSDPPMVNL